MTSIIKNLVTDTFKNSPSQLMVVKKMLFYGLSVKEGRIFCNDVEINNKSLAKACGVDQRVVKSVIKTISSDEELSKIFSSLESSINLKEVANKIGFGVLEISAFDPKEPGIIAAVSTIIAQHGINIRQAIVEDPEFIEEPRLYIITEEIIPGEIIPKIKNLKNIKSIKIL
ncbi:MAG: regulator [Thermoplasmata archaeon]